VLRASRRIPRPWDGISVKEVLLFAVPGLLYMLDNNIVFVILTKIDVTTLSVVWNVKIIITAVLFRLVMKRRLTTLKWLSGACCCVARRHCVLSVSGWRCVSLRLLRARAQCSCSSSRCSPRSRRS
jgi:hypothetical protein